MTADWKHGPHRLTYRQTKRTFVLVAGALAKDVPDGLPSDRLQRICDDLLEASIPEEFKNASRSLAVDWTDMETFSRPPPRGTCDCADPEASWGHHAGGGPGQDSELFFGYYASAATMVRDEHGPPVPELARRMTACSCRHDPARALVPVLTAMPGHGIPLGDILSDSGYVHRDAGPGPSRCAAPGPAGPGSAPARPRTPRHPPRRRRFSSSARSPATPPRTRPPPTTRRPPRPPATSSARSPATTPTATTGSCVPRPWARSAARSARHP